MALALVACHADRQGSTESSRKGGPSPPELASSTPAIAKPTAPSAASAVDPLAGFVRYAPRDGGFSVLMPADPKVATTNAPARGGAIQVHTAMVDDPAWAYSVSYYDIGDSMPEPGALFDDARAAVVRGLQGTLEGEKDIEIAGHPARESTIAIVGGTEFMRTIVVGGRVYSLVMVGQLADERRAIAYFDSFELHGEDGKK
jgi:hypothetical protein